MQNKPFYKSLYFQVIVAIVLGVTLGHLMPELGAKMKPLGDGFIKLVKMMIAPIIFCTIVVGIAGMEDMKKVGRVGGKALLYFEVVTTLALIIGLVLLTQPAISVLAGWISFGEMLDPVDAIGMVLVAAALVVARARQA